MKEIPYITRKESTLGFFFERNIEKSPMISNEFAWRQPSNCISKRVTDNNVEKAVNPLPGCNFMIYSSKFDSEGIAKEDSLAYCVP